MILRRIRLKNIRSYISQELALPEGSVLLSGDIGSGKSTILLAVDFALFGIQKGLSGASLLRHGEEDGSVELDFELGGREYSIKRTLRRKDGVVRQSSAFIISDGTKKDLTAQEARFFILDLLGYPTQALRKDSALIYRYTVYTPQEQMRHIIEADADERLGLIRRLFGIDKYKRIAENAEIFAKELRGRVRELSGAIADLDAKRKERKELQSETDSQSKLLKEVHDEVVLQEQAAEKKRAEVEALQEQIEMLQKKKQEYVALKAEFLMLKDNIEADKKNLKELDPRIKELEERLAGFKDLKKAGTERDIASRISVLEKAEKEVLAKSAALAAEIGSLSEILRKGICGTCGQNVADRGLFKKGIDAKRAEMERLEKEADKVRLSITQLRKDLEEVQRHASLMREKASVEERWKDLLELKARYSKEFSSKQEKLKGLVERANSLAHELKGESLSKQFKDRQKEYEKLRSAKEEAQRKESVLKQSISDLEKRIAVLDKEIKEREEAKEQMERYREYDEWIRDFFVRLMATIEKHVMVNIQHEFNALFQKWFSMLVMDEGLAARVDEDFSVVVEQDGFQTEYSFMSGGERTAIALAYRLALNRVVNDLIERIRTKDLVILDEPTDGFSTDQMTSVRDVLSELNSRQMIIVSHEPRIESFVDKTIRFGKENNISRVLTG